MKTEKIQGRINVDLHSKLLSCAKQRNLTTTEILEEAISFYLSKKDDALELRKLTHDMAYTLKCMHKERDHINAYLSKISSLIVDSRRKD